MTPTARRPAKGADWHVCLEALTARLDGAEPPPAGRWQQVHAGYVRRFGPRRPRSGRPPERENDGRPAPEVANPLRLSAVGGKLRVGQLKGTRS